MTWMKQTEEECMNVGLSREVMIICSPTCSIAVNHVATSLR